MADQDGAHAWVDGGGWGAVGDFEVDDFVLEPAGVSCLVGEIGGWSVGSSERLLVTNCRMELGLCNTVVFPV